MFVYADDVAAISALDDYKPSTITRLMAADGQQIGEFATERRVVIRYDDIAPVLRQAIIASEDAEFESHFGISVSRLLVTAIRDLGTGHRMRGASTITQQVARMLFLQDYMRGGVFARSGTAGLERKIKEWLIAFQLEKRYTKHEILAFYANHVPLDHGAYGVEAAARMYFDKSAKDLSIEEAASIVAIIPTPSRLSPFRNPEQNLARRNTYVLRRMTEEGYITAEEAAEAARRPLVLQGQPAVDTFGCALLRRGDPQGARAEVRRRRLVSGRTARADDTRRRRSRKPPISPSIADCGESTNDEAAIGNRLATFLPTAKTSRRFDTSAGLRPSSPGTSFRQSSRSCPNPRSVATRAYGSRATRSTSLLPHFNGPGARRPPSLFKVGDLIEVEVRELDGNVPTMLALEQSPLVEGALLAIDNETGQVRATGRRIRLHAQQVQSRHAGAAPSGLPVQTDRLHGRHRPWLHAGFNLRRRARVVRARSESATL